MKIYTYANPFMLDKEAFWDEIRHAPHFCVSQTLVQGLTRHYGRHAFNYICTADKVINALHPQWYQNVELKIEQYVSVSRQIEMVPDATLAKAFKFNQQALVDAFRFAITLGLDAGAFDRTLAKLPKEQAAFLAMLKNIAHEPCWVYENDGAPYNQRLDTAIAGIFMAEVEETLADIANAKGTLSDRIFACLELLESKTDEQSLRQRKILEHYTALLINPQRVSGRVVFHGIHQFTPKILSAVKALEKAGIEVVFLINYQSRYSHVYDTWKKVYAWTGCEVSQPCCEFPQVDSKALPSDDFECRLIGECIGNILEGRRSGDVRHENTILNFPNQTAFSDYVAHLFADAASRAPAASQALSNMKEQFYGVKGDGINEMLKFYFPEQFGERHFLSYPIGQFILSLYSMWDAQNGLGLLVDDTLIRECLAINIWDFHDATTPISVYEQVRPYIADLTAMDAIIARLEFLKEAIVSIRAGETNPIFAEFPFFSLDVYDVEYFIAILRDIDSIASELFAINPGETINFRDHFKKLIGMIGMKMAGNKHVSDAERKLVDEVQNRLSTLASTRPIVGSIDDLKQTVHYYLQNESDDKAAHWIVRNFEQIDGGVLLSRYTQAKTYHLALLSDRHMKQANEAFFPWPLSAAMLEAGQASGDSRTILTSYKEYRNFLRYCVFYGTYFLDPRKGIQFSFVEESGADKDIPYYLLTLLGLETVPAHMADPTTRNAKKAPETAPADEDVIRAHIAALQKPEQEIFVSCPFRFMLSHVLEDRSSFTDPFDSRRLYALLLFTETWQKNIGLPEAQVADKLATESQRLKKYFPFWKAVDFID
ncbi:MAG: hypothetical protein FWG38_03385, partial [Defluviitaleaceae bacterium]|nr:hypothetical protein [Defluviitaleaceae bacterium]